MSSEKEIEHKTINVSCPLLSPCNPNNLDLRQIFSYAKITHGSLTNIGIKEKKITMENIIRCCF